MTELGALDYGQFAIKPYRITHEPRVAAEVRDHVGVMQ